MSEKTALRMVSAAVCVAAMLASGRFAFGFDPSGTSVTSGEIVSDGAPKDGIPALNGAKSDTAADASDSPLVTITETRSYWTSFMGGGGFMLQPESDLFESRDGLFVVAGRLENRSGRTLNHVELLFELLDADGNVVASQEGFNRRAEALFDEAEEVPAVEAIPTGGEDSYRMIFFGDEIPAFETPRVSVRRAVFAPR